MFEGKKCLNIVLKERKIEKLVDVNTMRYLKIKTYWLWSKKLVLLP